MPNGGYGHYRNTAAAGSSVFVTTTCLDFVHVFAKPHLADLMAAGLLADCRHYGANLSAFVIMPHHLHVLLTLPQDKTVCEFINRLKSNAARRLLPQLSPETLAQLSAQTGLNGRSFWMRSFRSVPLNSESMFLQKVRYTHLNPVRAGLCAEAKDYRWSSARHWASGLWRESGGLEITDGLIEEYSPEGLLPFAPGMHRRPLG